MDLPSYAAVVSERHALPPPGECGLRQGQFHDVLLTPDAVYRFPRTEAARVLLPHHSRVLAALAGAGPDFAVPVPLAPVDADEPVGRCYLATTRVPGQPLGSGYGHYRTGAELGRVLAALTRLTPRLAGTVDAHRPDRWALFAADVETELFGLMSADGRRRARQQLDAVVALPAPPDPVLVHGDLGGDNLLWDPGPPLGLTGVVDWDGLGLGSPADDVASIAATYGWATATEAAERAGCPAGTLRHARSVQATFALQQALPAARSGDTANLDDGLLGYR
ncbi:aminoglycoside phosphotransferase family protein [Longispora sp. NPDC051575]|uniref:phosphotransferase family protein n=1 Tax=Longispora sp. NPDC051575 TaxID=3154943 RepID=UPI003437420F